MNQYGRRAGQANSTLDDFESLFKTAGADNEKPADDIAAETQKEKSADKRDQQKKS